MSDEVPPVVREASPARLVVADDHALLRSGIRSMLASEADLEIVGEAANGREALELCCRLRPDLVLMDVRMPEMDGLEATRAIKQEFPGVCVVMVTMEDDPDYLLEAVSAGAAGYLLKGASQEQLINALRGVLGGESPMDQGLAMQLVQRLAGRQQQEKVSPSEAEKPPAPLLEALTRREVEILRLLARGLTNPQISQRLVISPGTVKVHVQHIIAKLGVSDRTQAAVRALELGLLASPE